MTLCFNAPYTIILEHTLEVISTFCPNPPHRNFKKLGKK